MKLKGDENTYIKPFVKNSNLNRYTLRLNKDKLIYLRWEDNIQNLPNLYRHMLRYQEILEDQVKRYNENYPWYALHRPREEKIFLINEKILVPYRANKNIFSYYEKPVYSSRDIFFITPKSEEFNIKYILALLNSKLYYVWLYYKGKRKGETLELYQKPLSEIPIKVIPKEEQKQFIDVVDKILSITSSEDYEKSLSKQDEVRKYEQLIDKLVYKLYELTKEEINEVENFKSNKE